jgi:hypothetical protein
MGCNILARRCYTNSAMPLDINPNPSRFNIQYTEEFGNNLVAIIKYYGCTNYEGDKILVFKNMSDKTLRSMKSLDPHFSEDIGSPFARFQPTVEGFEAAQKLAELLCEIN